MVFSVACPEKCHSIVRDSWGKAVLSSNFKKASPTTRRWRRREGQILDIVQAFSAHVMKANSERVGEVDLGAFQKWESWFRCKCTFNIGIWQRQEPLVLNGF